MKKIKLSRGMHAIVDNEDYDWLSQYTWYINENANKTIVYAMRSKLKGESEKYVGNKIYMHRFILGITNKNKSVKHFNLNTLDNRKSNLFIADKVKLKKSKN